MTHVEGQTLIVAVTGSIAAYKACDLVRVLYREGARQVMALMTPGARAFLSPLTLESLTRHPVYQSDLENTAEGIPAHVALAQQADAMIVAPCSANTLAKLACGMADSMVTTTALTMTGKPLIVAPAMNTRMWAHPRVEDNVRRLAAMDHVTLVPPEVGDLACGETGDGKLASLEAILASLDRALAPADPPYRGLRYLVTAGGTREPLDAVRYLTNRGTGRMGLAMADALFAMGADVILVHTMGELSRPYLTLPVETAAEMAQMCFTHFPTCDGVIMAAAVGDYALAEGSVPGHKVKKQDTWTLSLEKTVDILEGLGRMKQPHQVVIGFAAETDQGLENARDKLQHKHADLIVLNDVSRKDIGFAVADNEVILVSADQPPLYLPKAPKPRIARLILEHAIRYHNTRHTTPRVPQTVGELSSGKPVLKN